MMNAPNVPGGASGFMSGTSPTHFVPSHLMLTRVGSHGWPLASAPARLYMMRRFAGHENAQLWYMPRPVGSAVLLRCALFPASVNTPECSQLPHSVVPSSCNCPNPSSCWPAVFKTLVGSFGSLMSASALPLISFSTSPRSGLTGLLYGHVTFKTASGTTPPSLR